MLALAGKLEACNVHMAQHQLARQYLTRPNLAEPYNDTPWQHLLAARNDRAFITTMGFHVNTFDLILNSGFREFWSTTTIQLTDVDVHGHP